MNNIFINFHITNLQSLISKLRHNLPIFHPNDAIGRCRHFVIVGDKQKRDARFIPQAMK